MMMFSSENVLFFTVCCFTITIVSCGLIASGDERENNLKIPIKKPVRLIGYEKNLREDGYDFNLETSDGFSKNENATTDKTGELKIKGDYYIKFPNGQYEFHEYTAGVNGVSSRVVFGNPIMTRKKIGSAAIASLAGGGLG